MNSGRAAVARRIKIKHVNTVRKQLADGSYRIHRYHRLTGQKLYGEPGSPEFRESYAEAELHAIRQPKTGLAYSASIWVRRAAAIRMGCGGQ